MPTTITCPDPNTAVSQTFGISGMALIGINQYVVCKATYYVQSGMTVTQVSKCMKCANTGNAFDCQFDLGQDIPVASPTNPTGPPPIAISAQLYNANGTPVDAPGTEGLTFAVGKPNPCPNAGAGTSIACP